MTFGENDRPAEGISEHRPVVIIGGWGTGNRRNQQVEYTLNSLGYPTILVHLSGRRRIPTSNEFPRVHQIHAEEVLERIPAGHVNIVAHSQGAIIGTIATILAQRRGLPITVDNIILVAPATKIGHDTPLRLARRFLFQKRNGNTDLPKAAQDLAENALRRPASLVQEVRAIAQTRLQDNLREIRRTSPQTQIYVIGFKGDKVFNQHAIRACALEGFVPMSNIKFLPGTHDSFYEPHFIEDVIKPLLQR